MVHTFMLFLVGILVGYIIVLHHLLLRAHAAARDAPKRESLADVQHVNRAGRATSQVDFSDAVQASQVAHPAKQKKPTAVHAAGPSTFDTHRSRGQSRVSATSGSQPGASGDANASATAIAPTHSLSSLGPSFVMKFADMKVNAPSPRLASASEASQADPKTRFAPGGRPWSLSPLSTPPRSPIPLSTPLRSPTALSTPPRSPTPSSVSTASSTPTGSHGQLGGRSTVDFSLYRKKTRTLTKSPQKPQTKAAGKLRAEFAADAATVTTWFFKSTINHELLAAPPDLTGHPEGISLGDLFFNSASGVHQLWLWSMDKVGAPHWKKISPGYERSDGKRLIVTRKNHLLSWVTASYYRQIGSSGGPSVGEGED